MFLYSFSNSFCQPFPRANGSGWLGNVASQTCCGAGNSKVDRRLGRLQPCSGRVYRNTASCGHRRAWQHLKADLPANVRAEKLKKGFFISSTERKTGDKPAAIVRNLGRVWTVLLRVLLWFRRGIALSHKYAALRLSGVPVLLASAASPETSLVGAAVAAARSLPVIGPAFEAFALVFFSEFGDKSMFSTALLSMRYGTRSMQTFVLLGSMAALTTMTFISCFLGRLMSFLPSRVTLTLSVLLLTIFGVRFLQQSIAAWRRDRARSSDSSSTGALEDELDEEAEAARDLERYKISIDDTPLAVFMKSFTIIALAEWCDRSMFATMALAASTNAYAVIIGATLANLVCTAMAVAGGSLFHKLPERIVNLAAGTLFLATAAYTWFFELPEADS